MAEPKYLCPVCGYWMDERPTNYNICPSCGTEFGVSDQDATIEELRNAWIATGPKWWSESERPDNWYPYTQLANLAIQTSTNCGPSDNERLAARVEALEKADTLVKAAVRLLRGDIPYPDWSWDEWITAAQLAGYDIDSTWKADDETVEAARKLQEGK